jgi:glycosyltransferase involved in cell wall biosynthesis
LTISAVLVCRNEEPFIQAWLEQASAYAEEILIGVHAPTDATADIIARFKAHSPVPIRCEWFPAETLVRFGFSVMKNEMVARASGDWIVCLDADEHIGPGPRELAEALEATSAAGYSALTLWWAEHPRPDEVPAGWTMEHRALLRPLHRLGQTPLRKCKVFRNRAGYWWRGINHKVLTRYDRNALAFCHDIGACVHHYGYLRRPEPEWKEPLYSYLICCARDSPHLAAALERYWIAGFYERNQDRLRAAAARFEARRDEWFPEVPRRDL